MKVNFSAFARTSAGSIIAVLAAAGASPEQMFEFVKKIDFSVLHMSKIQAFLKISSAMGKAGLTSSSPIEGLVNQMLCKLLRRPEDYKVRFKDLRYPLSVVATGLR